MSLPQETGGYGLGPGEGEALWFNGGLGVLKATGELTGGRFAAMELLAPKGFASPMHIHRTEDEFFVVLSGEVRVQHGDDVVEARGRLGRLRAARCRARFPCRFGGGSAALVLRPRRCRGVLPPGWEASRITRIATSRRAVPRSASAHGDRQPLRPGNRRSSATAEGVMVFEPRHPTGSHQARSGASSPSGIQCPMALAPAPRSCARIGVIDPNSSGGIRTSSRGRTQRYVYA
jgi:hypothetical protein